MGHPGPDAVNLIILILVEFCCWWGVSAMATAARCSTAALGYYHRRLRHHRPDPGIRADPGATRTALMQCPTSPGTTANTWAPVVGSGRTASISCRSPAAPSGTPRTGAVATPGAWRPPLDGRHHRDVHRCRATYANAMDGESHAAILLGEEVNGLLVPAPGPMGWPAVPSPADIFRRNGEGDAACNDGDQYYLVERP